MRSRRERRYVCAVCGRRITGQPPGYPGACTSPHSRAELARHAEAVERAAAPLYLLALGRLLREGVEGA